MGTGEGEAKATAPVTDPPTVSPTSTSSTRNIPGAFPSTAGSYTRTEGSRPAPDSAFVLLSLALLLVAGIVILMLSCTLYGYRPS